MLPQSELLWSETEWGLEPFCRINKQREIIALDRQGTQRQRPESPTATPPGMRVNTRYINPTKGTSSKKDAPSGMYTLHFKHTWWHRCVQTYDRTNFYSYRNLFNYIIIKKLSAKNSPSQNICSPTGRRDLNKNLKDCISNHSLGFIFILQVAVSWTGCAQGQMS